MNKIINRIRISLWVYLIPLYAYWHIVRFFSWLIQPHRSDKNAFIAYLCILGIMALALLASFIVAYLEIKRPWWVKFIFTLLFGILFFPVYIPLTIIGTIILFIVPQAGYVIASFLGTMSLFSTGIFLSYKGNLTVMRDTPKAVVVINHRSSGDYALAGHLGAYQPFRVMIGANLWRYRIFKRLFNSIGLKIIREKDKHTERQGALIEGNTFLREKTRAKVEVFAEAERNRDSKLPLLPFKRGAFTLACANGIPVIPMVVIGMDTWRRPGIKNTTTYVKNKKKIRWSFKRVVILILHTPKWIFNQIHYWTKVVFTEGINPTIVRVYTLDKVETVGKTPEEVKQEVWNRMYDAYVRYA